MYYVFGTALAPNVFHRNEDVPWRCRCHKRVRDVREKASIFSDREVDRVVFFTVAYVDEGGNNLLSHVVLELAFFVDPSDEKSHLSTTHPSPPSLPVLPLFLRFSLLRATPSVAQRCPRGPAGYPSRHPSAPCEPAGLGGWVLLLCAGARVGVAGRLER